MNRRTILAGALLLGMLAAGYQPAAAAVLKTWAGSIAVTVNSGAPSDTPEHAAFIAQSCAPSADRTVGGYSAVVNAVAYRSKTATLVAGGISAVIPGQQRGVRIAIGRASCGANALSEVLQLRGDAAPGSPLSFSVPSNATYFMLYNISLGVNQSFTLTITG